MEEVPIKGGNEKTSLELGFGGFVTSPEGYDVTVIDRKEHQPEEIRFRYGKRKVKIIQADMNDFCEGKYDLIIFRNSWHYVQDFEKMLRNLKKMLKKGGKMTIGEPGEESRWMSPVLQRGEPEFNEDEFIRKMKIINNAREELLTQKVYKVEDMERKDKGHEYVLTS